MMKCNYCSRLCNTGSYVPETLLTIDIPFCSDECLKKFRVERGYDKLKENSK